MAPAPALVPPGLFQNASSSTKKEKEEEREEKRRKLATSIPSWQLRFYAKTDHPKFASATVTDQKMPVGIWKVDDTRHILRYAEDTEDILLDMLGSVLCKNLKIFTSRRKTRGLQPQAS